MIQRLHFITLEGGEAAGKTTQLALLAARLQARGEATFVTREPGGTQLGNIIRHLLKHAPEGIGMAPETELLLFQASRAELVRKFIAPVLAAGSWVLSDRFADSTTVYQGAGRRLPMEFVAQSSAFAMGEIRPGLTLVLDVPPEEARRRQRVRSAEQAALPDRIEAEPLEFYQRVRAGYIALASVEPERVKLIPAGGTIEETAAAIWKEVADAFSL